MIGLPVTAAVYCCLQLFCVLLALSYDGMHLSLSLRRKITANFLYATFTNVYSLLLSRFYVFNLLLFLGERYVRMFVQPQKHLVQKLLRLQVSSLRCGVVFQLYISTSDA